MTQFTPNQRYTSEGEPELGIGIVTETGGGRVKIHFPTAGETRLYAEDNAPLRRVLFKVGDTIVDTQQQPMLIERVQEQNGLIWYIGADRVIPEAELGDVTVKHGVDDLLARGDVDAPILFSLRRETLLHDYRRRLSPISGFVGGRIDLIPHQLYIAHEVSSRYAPRVLLSDEVGLGKTIEASLILHRLLLSGRIDRVLILVPESLVHQWFVEILRRFNLWFHIFDEERCAALDESAPEGNPFFDDQLVICSTEFLAGSEKRARQALTANWDMLVVDEAHHLAWSVEEASREYQIVEALSRNAQGLLLLTATPEQLGLESHFARLRLLDPDRYADFDEFKNESQDHREVADLVAKLAEGESLNKSDAKLLTSLVDPAHVAAFMEGDDEARDHLIEELLDQHGPGRVIFRNTRAAMEGFPRRKAQLAPLEAEAGDDRWEKRLKQEFERDMGLVAAPTQPPTFWFKTDPRVQWLIGLIEQVAPAKILLICRTKAKVLALEEALRKRVREKVGVFHEDLTIVQRDRNAAWFAEPNGARLLLCSEIGSEGRNFQFAHHLVLLDLPPHPELLEQRIGRLDRIGQSEDIHIHVPYLIGSPQEALVRWFHEGLDAFETNLEGGNQLMQAFGERMRKVYQSPPTPEVVRELDELIADTADFRRQLKQTLADGRDRLLEMNSFRPRVAEKLVEQIRAEDQDPTLERYMTRVFEQFDVEMEDLASHTFWLYPPPQHKEAFMEMPGEGMSVTFERARALSREEVAFLSWDHPMVTGAIDMVLGTNTGAASFGVLRGGRPGILLEAQFVLETVGGQLLHVDRFLPPTPLRVVIDHTGEDVTEYYSVETFDQQLIPGSMEDLLDNESFVEVMLPEMISATNDFAEQLAAVATSQAKQQMQRSLDHEIDRLRSLQQRNPQIRPEEIQLAVDVQAKLASLIEDARVRLDSLLLVKKG